jgi:hypothetical protein
LPDLHCDTGGLQRTVIEGATVGESCHRSKSTGQGDKGGLASCPAPDFAELRPADPTFTYGNVDSIYLQNANQLLAGEVALEQAMGVPFPR